MFLVSLDQPTATLHSRLNVFYWCTVCFCRRVLQVAAEAPRSVYGSAREVGWSAPAAEISYFSRESIGSRPRKARSLLSLCIGQIGKQSVSLRGVWSRSQVSSLGVGDSRTIRVGCFFCLLIRLIVFSSFGLCFRRASITLLIVYMYVFY